MVRELVCIARCRILLDEPLVGYRRLAVQPLITFLLLRGGSFRVVFASRLGESLWVFSAIQLSTTCPMRSQGVSTTAGAFRAKSRGVVGAGEVTLELPSGAIEADRLALQEMLVARTQAISP